MTINQFKNLMAADLVISEWRSAPNTGWGTNRVSGIQIVHRPTGAMVQVNTERSQHKNKMIALEMLDQKVGSIMKVRATTPQQHAQAAELPDQTDDIFGLIREWAHLPEGQRGDVARNIIGHLNRSYMAGVNDTRFLISAEKEAKRERLHAKGADIGDAPYNIGQETDSRVTGNAQAAMSDGQIIEIAKTISDGGFWICNENEETIAFARAILASQQPVAAPEAAAAKVAQPEFSRDPDGDLALDWVVGDASLSVSFSKAGVVSWATGIEGASACGSQQVAQDSGRDAEPMNLGSVLAVFKAQTNNHAMEKYADTFERIALAIVDKFDSNKR